MNLRCIFSRHTVNNISKLNISRYSSYYKTVAAISIIRPFHPLGAYHGFSFINPKLNMPLSRHIHTSEQVNSDNSSREVEHQSQNDAAMKEFLSRFVWLMRKKLSEVYADCDRHTINGMLVVIVENVVSEIEKGGLQKITGADSSATPSQEFSEDLWTTVWEVSNTVLQDMEKEKKKEKMNSFLQSEEVKVMYRFAGEVGIRGDMLRELRFKWAREKMEKNDIYESLERLQKEGKESVEDNDNVAEDNQSNVSLPKRHGKIKYKIYGLDLSDSKWARVADRIHESGEVMWPQEPKPITGNCKIVTDKILSLDTEDDPVPLLGEWKDLFQPSRTDWIAFVDKLKEQNPHIYFKAAEFVLSEESFQANTHDYSKLIEALAEENRFEDVDRILHKMNENGIVPDVITSATLIRIYCKSGNLNQAQEAFQSLKAVGFKPDENLYNDMIMANVKAGNPGAGESLLREMETSDDFKPTKEIYMALIQSFFQAGNAFAADRIFNTMLCCRDFSPDLESLSLMVEIHARTGNPDGARKYFNDIIKHGHKPDDKTTARMIAAYEKRNLLDEALNLLLQLEKNGFEPGVETYTVLVDWLSKLELFDEAEQVLDKISELGEVPPFKLQVSLCDMHIKSGDEKKALQALGVLESKIELLEAEDFERIIGSLSANGFVQDAQRFHGLMEARGFVLSDRMKVSLMASQAIGKSNRSKKLSLLRDK